ncbi:SCO5555 family protein [Kitasatospora sp. NPDC004240]
MDDPRDAATSAAEGPDDQDVEALYALVAERLKQAHARVHALNVSADAKTALTRQLLIVTETAKRDLPEAARRLGRFVQDLDAGRPPGL